MEIIKAKVIKKMTEKELMDLLVEVDKHIYDLQFRMESIDKPRDFRQMVVVITDRLYRKYENLCEGTLWKVRDFTYACEMGHSILAEKQEGAL